MGDIADYLLAYEPSRRYLNSSLTVRCRRCNQKGLSWAFRKSWILVNPDLTLHNCSSPASANEFPIVKE